MFFDEFVQEGFHREGKAIGIFMAASNHFAAEHPDVIAVPKQCVGGFVNPTLHGGARSSKSLNNGPAADAGYR
ncbi:hypothetical protein [Paraburkholderia tagetis]|uniref:Uncharacterized protein n=1 Tax=Paraburkholderia tagetis TaxID=2913261 RepID=A0A9X1RTL2_9BURK|nr:hypothetical protein [Paraburkholderia tagetis]MCG5077100.1 hypothetical protein [Paraburkholderia tagetis]